MNIAVLGGRFDPPHIWHFWTAQQILENVKDVQQIILLPDYSNPLKPIYASPADRVEMLRCLETGRIKLSTLAVDRETVTYTVDIVSELHKDQLNKYFWIIGSDVTAEFSRWRDYQKLSRLIKFLVVPRKDYPIKSLPSNFQRVEGNIMLSNVSSTVIRERVKKGQTISGLVFPEVEEYIRKKYLYR